MDSITSTTAFKVGRDPGYRHLWITLIVVLLVLANSPLIRGQDLAIETSRPAPIASPYFSENTASGTSAATDPGRTEVFGENQPFQDAFATPQDAIVEPHDWRSPDKPLFRLRGRIDTDLIVVDQSAANQETYGNFQDAIGLRRARIGATGHFTSDLRYIAEIDLASGTVVYRDLFIGWGEVGDRGELRLGHMREPFSLEGGTSANSYAFLERSPTNDLDPARNWGLGYFQCAPDEESTIAIGVFHSGTGPSDRRGGLGDDSALTARWTTLPWYEDNGQRLMHVGFALSSRFPDHDMVVINRQPRSPLLDLGDSSASPFIPTIRIPARFQQLFNAQWALVNGPFSAQAEWYGTLIDQIGGQTIFYNGSYLNLSWFMTGEHRTYQTQNGVFGPVTVEQPLLRGFSSKQDDIRNRGYGAWELTTQLAYLDYSDSNTPPGPLGQVHGIRLPQVTIGVNWYLADRVRVMFNYTHAMPDEANFGTSSANTFSSRLGMFW